MAKYRLGFDIVVSVIYEVEADDEINAKEKAENINAQDVFSGSIDGLEWQWDEVKSSTITVEEK